MADSNQARLKIWGRANSVNVQKVLWCLRELDLAYERIDAGMAFGRNREPDYLAMNPNGRVPTLVDGDFVLWESNSVMRYLVLEYGQGSPLYPQAPKRRTSVDRWLDWTLSTLQPVDRPVFWALVRTPVEQRDMVAIQQDADAEAVQWRIVDAQLATRRFIEGDDFTIADIALGAYARRWFGVEGIQTGAAASRALVRAVRRPGRIPAVHRAADVVNPAYGDRLDQKPERSNSTIHKINTRVTTVTASRVVQLMPRLTHQSSAQLMITGTMISSCNELALLPLDA